MLKNEANKSKDVVHINMKVIPFLPVIGLIKDPRLRGYAKTAVSNLPDYFFEIPASSSGKYHSENDRKVGGLVHHTKSAVFAFLDIHRTNIFELFDEEVDLGIIALLIHDGLKNGLENGGHTVADHPLIASKFIDTLSVPYECELTRGEKAVIRNAIERHSGQWVNDYKGNKILTEPKTPLEKAVHLADYMASRKHIEYRLELVDVQGYTTN